MRKLCKVYGLEIFYKQFDPAPYMVLNGSGAWLGCFLKFKEAKEFCQKEGMNGKTIQKDVL